MKVAIDISSLIYGTGVSVYTRNLVENLIIQGNDSEFVLFGGSLRRYGELKSLLGNYLKTKNVSAKVYPLAPLFMDLLWNKLHNVSVDFFTGKCEVFHSSDWTQPPSSAFKVTTVHDLTPVLMPELAHPKIVQTHKRRLIWVKKEVDRIIVPSHTTANDLIKLGFDKDKVRVIGEAPDPSFTVPDIKEVDRIKNKYRVSGKYILSIGVNKRKNTERIMAAYERVKPGMDLKLIIVGYSHEKMKPPKGVIFTGHVEQNDMSALLGGAETLVYPSLHEGFGLPILEAFRCGVPVVTSNSGSMKEVAGNAAVLVDPLDIDSIANGVAKAFKNKENLKKEGQKEVAKYSWKETATKTIEVYKEFNR